MGALQNLELSPDDALAHEFMLLAKTCLHKGNFMVQNTIAGVQTLVSRNLMNGANAVAHYGTLPPVRTHSVGCCEADRW